MRISFTEFMNLCEVYDKDVVGRSQITKSGEGGRIQRKRKKTEPEIRRTKAIGGGKTAPVKPYKDRKDIGQTNKQRSKSGREQQPTQERGSASLSAREQQRKAAMERRAMYEPRRRRQEHLLYNNDIYYIYNCNASKTYLFDARGQNNLPQTLGLLIRPDASPLPHLLRSRTPQLAS